MSDIPKVATLIDGSTSGNRGLLRGISKFARLQGPWSFCRMPPYYTTNTKRKEQLPRFDIENISGIITNLHDSKKIREFIDRNIPTIIFSHLKDEFKDQPNIVADNDKIGILAAEHLIDRGFKNFAYCGFDNLYWSVDRGKSFTKRIEQTNLEVNFYSNVKLNNRYSWEKEQTRLTKWIESLPKPIGIMACNDDRGQDIIEVCKINGINIPEEIAVIGVDNDEFVCELSHVSLTSVSLNTERAGYEAALLLDSLMRGKKTNIKPIIVKPTHVVTRESSDIFSIEDRDTAEAIRFIREHSKESITVDDVVDAVSLSRRVLENRFRKFIGRSIQKEIRRVRVEHVAKMLLETNLPISKIASILGFPGVDHIARYFKKEKMMSLIDYRQKFGQK